MSIIYSSNMNLPIPVVGISTGPNYALSVDACFAVIDAHDHSNGNGVPITPNGININANFPLNNNSITEVKSVFFEDQVSLSALNSAYVIDGDLYYNDNLGNVIRITQSGSVAGASGTITGLPSGTASASYNAGSGKFVFQSATSTGADIDAASIIVREKVASGNGVTLSAATGLAAGYTMILPTALPASQKFMTLDNSGNVAASWAVDNSTLEISSNTLQIKDSGVVTAKINNSAVTTVKIADGAVTPAKLSALGEQLSLSCSNYSTTSTSYIDVTNLSVALTTTGRPVVLELVADGSGNGSFVGVSATTTSNCSAFISFARVGVTIAEQIVSFDGLTGSDGSFVPSSSVRHTVTGLAAGTYTFRVQTKVAGTAGTPEVKIFYAKLLAYEI